MSERHPTADRLIREGMRLFAERGMAGTPVTLIEQVVGLAPGRGAFYKHFRSKQDLYDAAVEDAALGMTLETATVEPRDVSLEDELAGIARGSLRALERNRDLLLVTMREHDLPAPSREKWPARGHEWFARWLALKTKERVLSVPDPEATAVALLGVLVSFWQNSQQPSTRPLDVTESRIIDAWVNLVLGLRPRKRK